MADSLQQLHMNTDEGDPQKKKVKKIKKKSVSDALDENTTPPDTLEKKKTKKKKSGSVDSLDTLDALPGEARASTRKKKKTKSQSDLLDTSEVGDGNVGPIDSLPAEARASKKKKRVKTKSESDVLETSLGPEAHDGNVGPIDSLPVEARASTKKKKTKTKSQSDLLDLELVQQDGSVGPIDSLPADARASKKKKKIKTKSESDLLETSVGPPDPRDVNIAPIDSLPTEARASKKKIKKKSVSDVLDESVGQSASQLDALPSEVRASARKKKTKKSVSDALETSVDTLQEGVAPIDSLPDEVRASTKKKKIKKKSESDLLEPIDALSGEVRASARKKKTKKKSESDLLEPENPQYSSIPQVNPQQSQPHPAYTDHSFETNPRYMQTQTSYGFAPGQGSGNNQQHYYQGYNNATPEQYQSYETNIDSPPPQSNQYIPYETSIDSPEGQPQQPYYSQGYNPAYETSIDSPPQQPYETTFDSPVHPQPGQVPYETTLDSPVQPQPGQVPYETTLDSPVHPQSGQIPYETSLDSPVHPQNMPYETTLDSPVQQPYETTLDSPVHQPHGTAYGSNNQPQYGHQPYETTLDSLVHTNQQQLPYDSTLDSPVYQTEADTDGKKVKKAKKKDADANGSGSLKKKKSKSEKSLNTSTVSEGVLEPIKKERKSKSSKALNDSTVSEGVLERPKKVKKTKSLKSLGDEDTEDGTKKKKKSRAKSVDALEAVRQPLESYKSEGNLSTGESDKPKKKKKKLHDDSTVSEGGETLTKKKKKAKSVDSLSVASDDVPSEEGLLTMGSIRKSKKKKKKDESGDGTTKKKKKTPKNLDLDTSAMSTNDSVFNDTMGSSVMTPASAPITPSGENYYLEPVSVNQDSFYMNDSPYVKEPYSRARVPDSTPSNLPHNNGNIYSEIADDNNSPLYATIDDVQPKITPDPTYDDLESPTSPFFRKDPTRAAQRSGRRPKRPNINRQDQPNAVEVQAVVEPGSQEIQTESAFPYTADIVSKPEPMYAQVKKTPAPPTIEVQPGIEPAADGQPEAGLLAMGSIRKSKKKKGKSTENLTEDPETGEGLLAMGSIRKSKKKKSKSTANLDEPEPEEGLLAMGSIRKSKKKKSKSIENLTDEPEKTKKKKLKSTSNLDDVEDGVDKPKKKLKAKSEGNLLMSEDGSVGPIDGLPAEARASKKKKKVKSDDTGEDGKPKKTKAKSKPNLNELGVEDEPKRTRSKSTEDVSRKKKKKKSTTDGGMDTSVGAISLPDMDMSEEGRPKKKKKKKSSSSVSNDDSFSNDLMSTSLPAGMVHAQHCDHEDDDPLGNLVIGQMGGGMIPQMNEMGLYEPVVVPEENKPSEFTADNDVRVEPPKGAVDYDALMDQFEKLDYNTSIKIASPEGQTEEPKDNQPEVQNVPRQIQMNEAPEVAANVTVQDEPESQEKKVLKAADIFFDINENQRDRVYSDIDTNVAPSIDWGTPKTENTDPKQIVSTEPALQPTAEDKPAPKKKKKSTTDDAEGEKVVKKKKKKVPTGDGETESGKPEKKTKKKKSKVALESGEEKSGDTEKPKIKKKKKSVSEGDGDDKAGIKPVKKKKKVKPSTSEMVMAEEKSEPQKQEELNIIDISPPSTEVKPKDDAVGVSETVEIKVKPVPAPRVKDNLSSSFSDAEVQSKEEPLIKAEEQDKVPEIVSRRKKPSYKEDIITTTYISKQPDIPIEHVNIIHYAPQLEGDSGSNVTSPDISPVIESQINKEFEQPELLDDSPKRVEKQPTEGYVSGNLVPPLAVEEVEHYHVTTDEGSDDDNDTDSISSSGTDTYSFVTPASGLSASESDEEGGDNNALDEQVVELQNYKFKTTSPELKDTYDTASEGDPLETKEWEAPIPEPPTRAESVITETVTTVTKTVSAPVKDDHGLTVKPVETKGENTDHTDKPDVLYAPKRSFNQHIIPKPYPVRKSSPVTVSDDLDIVIPLAGQSSKQDDLDVHIPSDHNTAKASIDTNALYDRIDELASETKATYSDGQQEEFDRYQLQEFEYDDDEDDDDMFNKFENTNEGGLVPLSAAVDIMPTIDERSEKSESEIDLDVAIPSPDEVHRSVVIDKMFDNKVQYGKSITEKQFEDLYLEPEPATSQKEGSTESGETTDVVEDSSSDSDHDYIEILPEDVAEKQKEEVPTEPAPAPPVPAPPSEPYVYNSMESRQAYPGAQHPFLQGAKPTYRPIKFTPTVKPSIPEKPKLPEQPKLPEPPYTVPDTESQKRKTPVPMPRPKESPPPPPVKASEVQLDKIKYDIIEPKAIDDKQKPVPETKTEEKPVAPSESKPAASSLGPKPLIHDKPRFAPLPSLRTVSSSDPRKQNLPDSQKQDKPTPGSKPSIFDKPPSPSKALNTPFEPLNVSIKPSETKTETKTHPKSTYRNFGYQLFKDIEKENKEREPPPTIAPKPSANKLIAKYKELFEPSNEKVEIRQTVAKHIYNKSTALTINDDLIKEKPARTSSPKFEVPLANYTEDTLPVSPSGRVPASEIIPGAGAVPPSPRPDDLVRLSQAKAILLGDVAAGKTSLLNALRFKKSRLAPAGPTGRTIGIEVHSVSLSDECKLWFYDFGGHDTYHYSHQLFLSDKTVYVLTVDIAEYVSEKFSHSVEYWYNILSTRLASPVMCILATHIDLCSEECINARCEDIREQLQIVEEKCVTRLRKQYDTLQSAMWVANKGHYDTLHDFHAKTLERPKQSLERLLRDRPRLHKDVLKISSKTLDGLPEFIDSLQQFMGENSDRFPTNKIPQSWIDLGDVVISKKEELPFIHKTDFKQIALNCGVKDRHVESALEYLQWVGILLGYEDDRRESQLKNFVFNNPNLLLSIFGLIFNHNYYMDEISFVWSNKSLLRLPRMDFETLRSNLRNEGLIGEKLLKCFWSTLGISSDLFDAILALLEKFDLCYELLNHAERRLPDGRHFRFPYLLKQQAPIETTIVWQKFIPDNFNEYRLKLKIEVPRLPLGFLEKVSVRINQYLDHRMDWKFGTVSFCNEGQDMVRIESPNPADKTDVNNSTNIVVSVRVRKDRRGMVRHLLMVLVAVINKILLRQYPGIVGYWFVVCGHCIKLQEKNSRVELDQFPADNVVFAGRDHATIQCNNCAENEEIDINDVFPQEAAKEEDAEKEEVQSASVQYALRSCHEQIMAGMDAKYLVAPLLKKKALSLATAQQVNLCGNTVMRNKRFLQIISTSPEECFHEFCEALRLELDQPRLSDMLQSAFYQHKKSMETLEQGRGRITSAGDAAFVKGLARPTVV